MKMKKMLINVPYILPGSRITLSRVCGQSYISILKALYKMTTTAQMDHVTFTVPKEYGYVLLHKIFLLIAVSFSQAESIAVLTSESLSDMSC